MATTTSTTGRTVTYGTEHKLSPLTWASIVLVIIGALNWGLVGLFKWNLVAAIFGNMSVISRIIYVIVAAAGLYLIGDAARLREARRGHQLAAT